MSNITALPAALGIECTLPVVNHDGRAHLTLFSRMAMIIFSGTG
jgi:hypothetical protein